MTGMLRTNYVDDGATPLPGDITAADMNAISTAVNKAVSSVSMISVLTYGADPTGVADSTSAFVEANAAIPPVFWASADLPTGGGRVYAPTGRYKISASFAEMALQGLRGDGKYLTILDYTGTGPCIDATNPDAPTGWPTPVMFDGFGIDGSNNSNAGSGGIKVGNLDNSIGYDIQIQNFYQTDGFGIAFENYLPDQGEGWSEGDPFVNLPASERMHWKVSIRNCTNAVIFDGAGINQGQFNFCTFDFEVFCSQNQNGLTFQNDALMGGSKLSMVGNFTTGSGDNTGWVIGMDVGNTSGVSAIGSGSELYVVVETDGPADSTGHKTLILGSDALGGIDASGTMWFVPPVPGFSTWQAAEIGYAATWSFGPNLSEPTLGTMSFGDAANFKGGTQRNVFILGSASIGTTMVMYPQFGDVQQFIAPNNDVEVTSFYLAPYATSRTLDILIEQPASGDTSAWTWPSNVAWIGGGNTLSTVNGAVDKIHMQYYPYDDKWYAELVTRSEAPAETITASSATPIVLTSTSTPVQSITGTTTAQILQLPSAYINAGRQFFVSNRLTGANVTVEAEPFGDTIVVLEPDEVGIFTCAYDTPTASYGWSGTVVQAGQVFQIANNEIIVTTAGTAVTYTLPTASSTLLASGGALGEPSSGDLTNCINLPLDGLAAAAYSTTPAASKLAEWDTHSNLSANNVNAGIAYITAAGGVTTLTASDAYCQVVLGATTQTIKLPTTGVPEGFAMMIENGSTGVVTVEASDASFLYALPPSGGRAVFRAATATPVASTAWIPEHASMLIASGKLITFSDSLNFIGTDGTSFTFPTSNDTVAGVAAVQALAHKDLTDVTNTFPTLNQNTTGNAATATKLATARNINGVAFDGTAAITVVDSTAEKTVNKNVANGYAGLDSGGKIPAALYPSAMDEVIEYANLAAFPGTGVAQIIYLAQDTEKIYRWSGSIYVEISPSPGSTDSVSEGSVNLYYTNARADARVAAGNAASATKLQTARNIDGQAFDGTAAITVIAPGTHAATSKSTPVDADELPLADSAASYGLKKLTWANIKAILDGRYVLQETTEFVEYIGTTSLSGITVPSGILGLEIISMIAPGGGGGSGAREPSGTIAGGGGGGGSGGVLYNVFIPAEALGTTYAVNIPAAGPGGAAQTTASTNGNPGTTPSGFASFVSGTLTVRTQPGSGGGGGTNAAGGAAGAAGGVGNPVGLAGGAGSSTTTAAGAGIAGSATAGGGGGGGGVTATPAASNGGNGGFNNIFATGTPSAGFVGGASPTAGPAAISGTAGAGGGGGAGTTSGVAQSGATPLGYGGGGGAGGGSIGTSSGAGGNGGPGYIGLKWVYL